MRGLLLATAAFLAWVAFVVFLLATGTPATTGACHRIMQRVATAPEATVDYLLVIAEEKGCIGHG